MAVKFALRYNLLKFYIMEATAFCATLKKKAVPDQAKTDLNWAGFF